MKNHSLSTNVLMIGWEYPPHNSGGLGVACEGLTHALSDQNVEIFFTLPYHHQGPVSHMHMVDCIDPSWLDEAQLSSSYPPFAAYSPDLDLIKKETNIANFDVQQIRALPQSDIERKVNEYAEMVENKTSSQPDKFQVIHAHDWMSFPAAQKVSRKIKKPYVAHIHSTEFDRAALGSGSQYITQVEYEGMKQAAKVITVSYYTKRLLIKHYGIDHRKIEVVHNGVNPLFHEPNFGNHHFAQKRPVVAFMGRLTLQKGGYHFIEMARQVTSHRPDVLFVVAGSGELYHELMFKVADDALSASVLFSGFVRDRQKEILLERADVFVMPSISEPFGLVAVEAAQRHTPVIVSKNSGVSEVMPGSIAVDYWDIDKMTQSILGLLENDHWKNQVVKDQLKDLEEVTWHNSAQKIRDIYLKAFLGPR